MAITLTTRGPDGQLVTTPFPSGDTSPGAGTADAAPTDVRAAPGAAAAAASQATERSAPQPPDAPAEPGRPSAGSAAEAGAADTDDDEPEPAVATMDYVQRSIRRHTRRLKNVERAHAEREGAWSQERAHLQGQLEVMHRMMAGATPELAPPAQPTGPPQAEQYASHDDYVLAAARYGARQELQARDQQTQQAQQQAQQQAMQQQLIEREAAFKEAHPDFDAVVGGLVGKVAPHVQQALMLLPDGPALAYTLAGQAATLARLNTLPPPLVFAELGRLRPGAPDETPPAPGLPTATTNGRTPSGPPPGLPPPLPPPPTPLSGMGSGAPSGATADMDQAEFRRLWNTGWRPGPRDFGRT